MKNSPLFFRLSVCISIFVLKFQGYRYHFPVEMNELFCQITAMRLWNSEIKRLEVANTLETYTFSHCLLWVHCDHDDQISRNKYSIFFQIAEYYWIKHANYHCNAVIEQRSDWILFQYFNVELMISVDGKYDFIGKSRNKETIWSVVDKKNLAN